MEYLDFELEIERVGRGKKCRAKVRNSPAGRGAQTSFMPPAVQEIEDLRRHWEGWRSGAEPRNLRIEGSEEISAEDFGLQLFESVFTGPVLEGWRVCLASWPARVRLRLALDNDPHLLRIPWELLFDPDLKDFLATAMPFVRTLSVPVDHQRSLAGPGPLRILSVLSSPEGCGPIDTSQEWSLLDAALGDSVELKSVLPHLDAIEQALQSEEWHVLHYIGHGSVDDKGGSLILEGRQGDMRPVGHLRLAKFLSHASLRLIVLNTCDGGQPGRDDPFSGVAQALLRQGVPAVVAMQQPISDKAAIALARELYSALAEGLPLDAAMARVRARLYRDFEMEWAIPVLYLNAASGEILTARDPEPLSPPPLGRWKRISLITAGVLLVTWMIWLSLRPPHNQVAPQALLRPPPKPLRPASANSPDCPSPPGLDIAFVRIDAGSFEMGDSGAKESKPVHEVTITQPFCLGTYEVTRELWTRVLDRPTPPPSERKMPVEGVTFDEVRQFFVALRKWDASDSYRLPTEAEWELAARAGTKTRYSFGRSDKDLYLYGNCKGEDDGYATVAPVGQLKENGVGLFDVHGNVSEWVLDWYGEYSEKAEKDPRGPDQGTKRVRRGGNWTSGARSCASGIRSSVYPERDIDATGFRIVREIR